MKPVLLSLLLLTGGYLLQAQTPTAEKAKNVGQPSISTHSLATGLIRVGKEGIETGNDNVLNAYFSNDFVLHRPGGDMTLAQLKAYWTSLRRALTGFSITREQIIVEGNMVGARSTFSGTFDQELTQSAVGTIQPTGQRVKIEVISTFRYNDAGQLVEEWVQNDGISVLKEFGLALIY